MAALTAAEALRPLPAGYRQLYEQVIAAAEADDRIRALWLSGSLGRGVADAGSDLDIVLAVQEESFAGFTASWRGWLATATPTVLARELPRLPGSWYSMTPDCLRLDVVTERAGTATPGQLSRRLLVLDKDGTAAGPGSAPESPPGPDPEKIAGITEEFLRQQAIFPAAVVARADWLLGVVGIEAVHTMLYELFVQSNQPLPPMGVKQWSAKLTPGPAPDLREPPGAGTRARAGCQRYGGRGSSLPPGGSSDSRNLQRPVACRARRSSAPLPAGHAWLDLVIATG